MDKTHKPCIQVQVISISENKNTAYLISSFASTCPRVACCDHSARERGECYPELQYICSRKDTLHNVETRTCWQTPVSLLRKKPVKGAGREGKLAVVATFMSVMPASTHSCSDYQQTQGPPRTKFALLQGHQAYTQYDSLHISMVASHFLHKLSHSLAQQTISQARLQFDQLQNLALNLLGNDQETSKTRSNTMTQRPSVSSKNLFWLEGGSSQVRPGCRPSVIDPMIYTGTGTF